MKCFILSSLLVVASASFFGQAPGPTEADQPAHSQVQAPHSQVQASHSQVQAPHSQVQATHSQVQAAGPGEADTNSVLARAQHKVNYNALHYGGGVGTAPYYGVPGTDLKGVHNDGRHYGHGYGHGLGHNSAFNRGYGYGGYGHGGYGHGLNGHNSHNGHNSGYHSGHHGGYYGGNRGY